MDVAPHLIFKGGTSLSKGWKLIQRFSEDIDLAIEREFLGFPGDLSNSGRKKLRRESVKFVEGVFFKELVTNFEKRGMAGVHLEVEEEAESDKDRRINVYYPSVIDSRVGYLRPRVQIEMGCRSLREPFTLMDFSSLVDESYPDAEFTGTSVQFPTANPERTFLEKVFLLHEEFQRPPEKMRVDRLSRHLYDVVKLSSTPFADKALADSGLWEAIVHHRYGFTRVGGVDYNLHQPASIDPVPASAVVDAWRTDYKTMIEEMIYEENPMSFDEVIESMTMLKAKINALPWKMTKTYPVPN